MSDLNKLAAVQAVVSSFMADVKDLLKISIDGYAQFLSLIPEERRADVVLAVLANSAAEVLSSERIATKVVDAATVVIPAVANAKMASAERSAAASEASRKAEHAERAEERARLASEEADRKAVESIRKSSYATGKSMAEAK